jgi:glycosyltransferase involved in cell wall biosynthesis
VGERHCPLADLGPGGATAGAVPEHIGLVVAGLPTQDELVVAERRLVSIIVPARNEEGNIERLETELNEALSPLPHDFEFILVDNHSEDRTGALVKEICLRDPRWRYIRFSRDFSVEMSITAGYQAAQGEAIIVLYSDLQDPPSVIPALLKRWEEGYDVVYGVRTARPGDAWWRNIAVHLAYRLISRLSDIPIPVDTGDFRLISRRIRDVLVQLPEQSRYMRGLVAWLGFRQVGIPYARRPRHAGRSKGPVGSLLVFTLNAISSFSMKPLRLFTMFGLVAVLGSSIAALAYSLLALFGAPPSGVTTIIVLLWLIFGFNMLGIGMLGEYLGRTYLEVKGRPLFIVEETLNVHEQFDGLGRQNGSSATTRPGQAVSDPIVPPEAVRRL